MIHRLETKNINLQQHGILAAYITGRTRLSHSGQPRQQDNFLVMPKRLHKTRRHH